MIVRISFVLAALLAAASPSAAQAGKWSYVAQSNAPVPREECSFAQAGGKFYLLGGRGVSPVQEYNPAGKAWKDLGKTPVELNHFQALSLHGLVYVVCALNGAYPHEVPVPNMYIFDPLTDTWIKGMTIPQERLRGSAGVAFANGKIYVALGIKDGHSSGWVPYLDEYDPATGAWKALADAPRERDHFQTAIANGRLYALGGRRSSYKVNNVQDIFFDLEKVDVYDIAKASWSTLPAASNHPLLRSGTVNTTLGDEIIVAGGGSLVNGSLAHKETHALNTVTNAWRALAPLNTGRQVLGGVLNNGGIYLASGSGGSGGSPTLNTMEVFFLGDSTAPSGAALSVGQVAAAETPFNLGMIATGQKGSRVLEIKHSGGTQGVLISGATVTGTGFAIKAAPAYPVLAAPGMPVSVELEFASTGTAADGILELALAVPKGVTVKIPLEANRKALSVSPRARVKARGAVSGISGSAWRIREPGRKDVYRNGNGRLTPRSGP